MVTQLQHSTRPERPRDAHRALSPKQQSPLFDQLGDRKRLPLTASHRLEKLPRGRPGTQPSEPRPKPSEPPLCLDGPSARLERPRKNHHGVLPQVVHGEGVCRHSCGRPLLAKAQRRLPARHHRVGVELPQLVAKVRDKRPRIHRGDVEIARIKAFRLTRKGKCPCRVIGVRGLSRDDSKGVNVTSHKTHVKRDLVT